jgi:myo-inositol-1(or 4)-monophosphatase
LYQERLAFIKDLAQEAGRLTLEGFGQCGRLAKDTADGYDIATEYDFRTEDLVKERLDRAFGEPVLGEEDGLVGDPQLARQDLWIVDPIDGTFNYQRGLPYYGVSIAFCQAGIPVCGAIYLPALDELFYATKGGGAFLVGRHRASPTRLTVSQEREPEKLVISLAGQGVYRLMSACAAQGIPWRSLRFLLSAVASMAYVAAGRTDLFSDTALSLWDCAAGDLLLQEAGGPATFDYQGLPIFPEYVERWLVRGQREKFSVVAASSHDLFDGTFRPILDSAGYVTE